MKQNEQESIMRFKNYINEGAREIRKLQIDINYNIEKLKLLLSDPEHDPLAVEEMRKVISELKMQLQELMGSSDD